MNIELMNCNYLLVLQLWYIKESKKMFPKIEGSLYIVDTIKKKVQKLQNYDKKNSGVVLTQYSFTFHYNRRKLNKYKHDIHV